MSSQFPGGFPGAPNVVPFPGQAVAQVNQGAPAAVGGPLSLLAEDQIEGFSEWAGGPGTIIDISWTVFDWKGKAAGGAVTPCLRTVIMPDPVPGMPPPSPVEEMTSAGKLDQQIPTQDGSQIWPAPGKEGNKGITKSNAGIAFAKYQEVGTPRQQLVAAQGNVREMIGNRYHFHRIPQPVRAGLVNQASRASVPGQPPQQERVRTILVAAQLLGVSQKYGGQVGQVVQAAPAVAPPAAPAFVQAGVAPAPVFVPPVAPGAPQAFVAPQPQVAAVPQGQAVGVPGQPVNGQYVGPDFDKVRALMGQALAASPTHTLSAPELSKAVYNALAGDPLQATFYTFGLQPTFLTTIPGARWDGANLSAV